MLYVLCFFELQAPLEAALVPVQEGSAATDRGGAGGVSLPEPRRGHLTTTTHSAPDATGREHLRDAHPQSSSPPYALIINTEVLHPPPDSTLASSLQYNEKAAG